MSLLFPHSPQPRLLDLQTCINILGSEIIVTEWIEGLDFRFGCIFNDQGQFELRFGTTDRIVLSTEENALGRFALRLEEDIMKRKTFESYAEFFTARKPETSLTIFGTLYGQNKESGELGTRGAQYSSRSIYFRISNAAIKQENEPWKLLDWAALDVLAHGFSMMIDEGYYQGPLNPVIFPKILQQPSLIAAFHKEDPNFPIYGLMIKENPPTIEGEHTHLFCLPQPAVVPV